MSWARDEFKTLELGDQRLNARAVLLAERLSSKPTESIPNACMGWAET
nr:transposase [Rhodoferax sp.]